MDYWTFSVIMQPIIFAIFLSDGDRWREYHCVAVLLAFLTLPIFLISFMFIELIAKTKGNPMQKFDNGYAPMFVCLALLLGVAAMLNS